MAIIKELEEAFEEVLNNTNESDEFKRRFIKLISGSIENVNKNIYSNEDFKEIIKLIKFEEEGNNGY